MFQNRISDLNPTMAAKKSFESILETIQASNLNFQLRLSPFSATISLKKSLIRDKSGNQLLPPSPNLLQADQKQENQLLLEEQNNFLLSENIRLNKQIQECQASGKSHSETVQTLEKKIAKIEASALKSFEERKSEEAALKKSLKAQNREIEGFRKDLQVKKNVWNFCSPVIEGFVFLLGT